MGLLKVSLFDSTPKASGLSIAVGETKAGSYFRLGISFAAQEEFFGGELNVDSDAIALTLTDDPKHRHLMGIALVPLDDDRALRLTGGIKGSVSLRLKPWRTASGKRPATALTVVNRQVAGGGISVRLPDWVTPPYDPRLGSAT